MFSVYVSLLTKQDCIIHVHWKLFYQLRLAICGLKKVFFHVFDLYMASYNAAKNCTDLLLQYTNFLIIFLLLNHIQSTYTAYHSTNGTLPCPVPRTESFPLSRRPSLCHILPLVKRYDLAQAPFIIFNNAFRNIIKSTQSFLCTSVIIPKLESVQFHVCLQYVMCRLMASMAHIMEQTAVSYT